MALLALLACTGIAWAGTGTNISGTDNHAPSVDAVIVLDQSVSMHSEVSNSDPNDYRLDAAQMFIGMCDITDSRVAFIPFSGRIPSSDKTGFVNMNDIKGRQAQLDRIEKLRGDLGFGNYTDVGIALTEAVKMLINRTDTSNQPMILLLTDGKNDVGDPTIKKVDRWDPQTKAFVNTTLRNYNNEMADQLCQEATDVAAEYGVPIYTIALYSAKKGIDHKDVREYVGNLQLMSDETNGLSIAVSSVDALLLPKFFGSMFATQIGSTLLKDKDLTIYPVEGKVGRYAVDLPILNQSVMEANIFIPLANINPETIWLLDANSVDKTRGAKDVLTSKSKYFKLYKITNPRSLGNWRLEFEMLDPNMQPTDISFSLLYNYDISLKTQIGKSASTLNAISEGLSLAKDETIHVSSRFYTSNNVPSNDLSLYAVQNGATWETIHGTYLLMDALGNEKFKGEMTSQGDCFTADIDLRKAMLSSDGKNKLKGGAYTLRIIADGAGLHRENDLPITLINNPPEVKSNPLHMVVYVDDPADPVTQKLQTVEFNLSDNVKDPDNDQLVFSELKPVGSAREIIDMERVAKPNGSVAAVGTTIYDAEKKLFKYGVATYALTVTDQEETRDIDLEVTVRSKTSESLGAFTYDTSVEGLDPNSIAPKNSDVVFSMHLVNKASNQADTSGAIKDFKGTIDIFNASNTNTYLQAIDMKLSDDGTQLTGVYHNGNKKDTLKAVCTYTFGHTEQVAGEYEQIINIVNHPPYPVQAMVDTLPTNITYDPLPSVFAFLEATTPDESMTFPLSTLFKDEDNEAGLVFGTPSVTASSDTDAASLLQTESDGKTIRLRPMGEGQVKLILTATDGDDETATITRTINIGSVRNKWSRIAVIAAIALAALSLLIFLLWLKNRPTYPKESTISTFENAAIYPSVYELIPIQKAIPLSHCVDMDLAGRNDISNELLASIIIKPLRTPKNSISVRMAKPFPGYLVELEHEPIGKKPAVWASNHELKLSGRGKTTYLRVLFAVGNSESSSDQSMLSYRDDDVLYPVDPYNSNPFGGNSDEDFGGQSSPSSDRGFNGFTGFDSSDSSNNTGSGYTF